MVCPQKNREGKGKEDLNSGRKSERKTTGLLREYSAELRWEKGVWAQEGKSPCIFKRKRVCLIMSSSRSSQDFSVGSSERHKSHISQTSISLHCYEQNGLNISLAWINLKQVFFFLEHLLKNKNKRACPYKSFLCFFEMQIFKKLLMKVRGQLYLKK